MLDEPPLKLRCTNEEPGELRVAPSDGSEGIRVAPPPPRRLLDGKFELRLRELGELNCGRIERVDGNDDRTEPDKLPPERIEPPLRAPPDERLGKLGPLPKDRDGILSDPPLRLPPLNTLPDDRLGMLNEPPLRSAPLPENPPPENERELPPENPPPEKARDAPPPEKPEPPWNPPPLKPPPPPPRLKPPPPPKPP